MAPCSRFYQLSEFFPNSEICIVLGQKINTVYRVKSLRKNLQDPSKLLAVLSVQKVSYPIGELQYQTLRLESNNALNSKLWKRIESEDFDPLTKTSNTSIGNLLRNVTYWPVYEFHLLLDSPEMGNLSKISWECKGLVR